MFTSYSIEKIASSNRHEALAAAAERRTRPRVPRAPLPAEPRPESPATGTIRIPRQRRWFGVAICGPMSADPLPSMPVAPAARPVPRSCGGNRTAHRPGRGRRDPPRRGRECPRRRCPAASSSPARRASARAGSSARRSPGSTTHSSSPATAPTWPPARSRSGSSRIRCATSSTRSGPDALTTASARPWRRCCPGRSRPGTSSGCSPLGVRRPPRSGCAPTGCWSGWSRTCTGPTLPPATSSTSRCGRCGDGLLVVATVRTDDPERLPADEAALTSYVAGLARLPGDDRPAAGPAHPDQVRAQLLGPGRGEPATGGGDPDRDSSATACRSWSRSSRRPAAGRDRDRVGRRGRPPRRALRRRPGARRGRRRRRGTPADRTARAGRRRDARRARRRPRRGGRAGMLTTDHAADAVGFRHALLREAADRELGPGARRSWHRRWAEVLEANPGVLAADPAALAIAEHWHQARTYAGALGRDWSRRSRAPSASAARRGGCAVDAGSWRASPPSMMRATSPDVPAARRGPRRSPSPASPRARRRLWRGCFDATASTRSSALAQRVGSSGTRYGEPQGRGRTCCPDEADRGRRRLRGTRIQTTWRWPCGAASGSRMTTDRGQRLVDRRSDRRGTVGRVRAGARW